MDKKWAEINEEVKRAGISIHTINEIEELFLDKLQNHRKTHHRPSNRNPSLFMLLTLTGNDLAKAASIGLAHDFLKSVKTSIPVSTTLSNH